MSALAGARPARIELACFAALAALAALQWASPGRPSARRRGSIVAVAPRHRGAGARSPRSAAWLARARGSAGRSPPSPAICFLPDWWSSGSRPGCCCPATGTSSAPTSRRSLDGVADVPVPYAGADSWTRLVILLASPLVVGLAAFAAFWPTRRRAAGRICALVLLSALYLVAVAWARPDRQLAGGILLAVLICAWLWLPGIAPRSRGAASIAVVAAAAWSRCPPRRRSIPAGH